jgi:hypothetical protein
MKCQELAEKIQRLEPSANNVDVARLCLLISNSIDDLENVDRDEELRQIWRETGLKVQAATDQHAAMTEELEDLARSDPKKFSKEQVWILIRAIKVQSQILQLYIGGAELDV